MADLPDPLDIAARLRRDLDALDAAAIRRALQVYGLARLRLVRQIDALILALGDPSQPFAANMVSLASRAELLRQIETQLTRAGIQIEPALIQTRREAIRVTLQAAEDMAAAQGFSAQQRIDVARQWARLDDGAVKQLVDTLADGTPLNRWLRNLGPETREAVEETLERAVVERVNVGELARELSAQTGMAERRALMTTRESTFGVQRAANDQVYKANESRLSGKMRVERTDGKTCRACLAQNGEIYPVDARMPSHPGCRRQEIPILRSGRGLQEVQSGEDWLREQPEAVQRSVLGGEAGYEAWASGDVALADFTEIVDTEWGPQSRIVGANRARLNANRRTGGERRAAD